jgi:hypothetical protein
VSIGVKFALGKYLLHEKKRHLRSTSLRSQPTMDAKLMLDFLHFVLSNFRHAYLRPAKGCISRLVRHKPVCTISAFRKLHLAKFFFELGFPQRGAAEIGGCNCHPAKIETGKTKTGEIQISQMFLYFITKQLFNFCYRDICHFSPAVRFIPRPLAVADSRNIEKKF